jgi:1-acyl-sn-glycerol-3-phosphate acyltransferase
MQPRGMAAPRRRPLAGAGQAGVAVLLAANHISMIDVFVILGALRREVQRRITTLEVPVSGT